MLCLITARDARYLRSNVGRVFTIALIGLLAALIEQPFYINIAYAILCLSGIAIINAQGPETDFTRWLNRWTRWLAATGWMRFFTDNSAVMQLSSFAEAYRSSRAPAALPRGSSPQS